MNIEHISILFRIVKSIDEGISFLLFFLLFFNHIYARQSVKRTEIDIPFLLFFLLGIFSSIIHSVPIVVFSSQLIIYIKSFLFFYIFMYIPISREILRQYLKVFFWAGVILFLFGLVDLVAPVQFRQFTGNSVALDIKFNITSVKSLLFHPAVFGWFMNFLSLYCFAFFIVFKRRTLLLLGFVFLAGAFLSMRVKSIVGFMMSLWLGFLIYPYKKGKKTIAIILSLMMVIIFIFLGSMFFKLFESKYTMYFNADTYADSARNMLYLRSIDIASDYFPLGVGFGRYGSWMSSVYYSPVYYHYGLSLIWGMSKDFSNFITDTFWPMIIGETGFLGLVFYIAIFGILLRILFRNVRKRKDPLIQAFFLGTYMVFIESIIESIAAPIYVTPPFSFFIFGVLGISMALRRIED